MKKSVVIVAGGKGLRMGSDLPKQFLLLAGRPVLMHTIGAFYNYDSDMRIILVLPLSHQEYWKKLCSEYHFDIPYLVASGGDTRFHSVKNGLEYVGEGLVAIQDGVRPFGSSEMISRCFETARLHQTAIPVINSTDSLREITGEGQSRIIDRSRIRLVQTPQVFHVDVLKRAYQCEYNNMFTDDASVVEAMGMEINLVEGEPENIKITTPLDLKIGELILQNR